MIKNGKFTILSLYSLAEHNSMDYDPTNSLKRCNSTPTINNILPAANKTSTTSAGALITNTINMTSSNLNITSTTSRSR